MDRPSLIFYHGFLGGSEDWLPVINYLSDDFDCLALDLNTLNPFTTAETHLRAQNIQPRFLIGYSMGGRIAWRLASCISSSLQGLIVLGAHPGLILEEDKRVRYASDQKWIELLEQGDMATFLQIWYAQPIFATLHKDKELFEQLLQQRRARDPKILAEMLRTMSLAHQMPLPIFSPTLFLHGAHDLKYANLYSDRTFVEAIPDAGHAAHVENPLAVADAIHRFVESYTVYQK